MSIATSVGLLSSGVLIDVDHAFDWNPKYFSELFPRYFGEGLTFAVRTSVYPCILHLWLWPILLLAAAFLLRSSRAHIYLLGAAGGWALHVALDGVAVII